ncbi:MAG: cbb3-type cytochrome oxidase assembly protein CcoS [Bacteroidetes bacterium]|nr:cbb3-type cytochrome oxidase assembly protein CcoS [Bacteroidota bacterium]
MNVLFFLVPIALALAAIGALAFRWAVNSGQFEDLESPAIRMLIDDEKVQADRADKRGPNAAEAPESAPTKSNNS